ncbi:DBH-like monooxygenase protein 1 [Fukomys damarensis]|uniref:DBH-like monooxygenase protein 1 n=1 Tax=Fukomys damarensis TaxID=885580 RepID=A0A091D9B1_FUKDA|nr:DBH-like monooxygenase protein 1 [Fukomys damarensis]
MFHTSACDWFKQVQGIQDSHSPQGCSMKAQGDKSHLTAVRSLKKMAETGLFRRVQSPLLPSRAGGVEESAVPPISAAQREVPQRPGMSEGHPDKQGQLLRMEARCVSAMGSTPPSPEADTGREQSQDYFTNANKELKKDPQQDYHLEYAMENDTHTIIEFTRELHSCDVNDKSITDSTVRVIWAYHHEDVGDTGPKYHGSNRGTKSLRLLNPEKTNALPTALPYFDLVNHDVPIPNKDTTYWCQMFKIPTFQEKHHVIKVEPVIHRGHESLVHHIMLYQCSSDFNDRVLDYGHECYHPNMPDAFFTCETVVFAWAIGGEGFSYPPHVGLSLGTPLDPQYVLLEVHYDNPTYEQGLIDSSGLRLYHTVDLRQYDAGMIQAGLWVSLFHTIPPGMPEFWSEGHCTPECLQEALEAEKPSGIHVFAVLLHTHLAGRGIRLRHFRKGKEMKLLAYDDDFDFNFQEFQYLQDEQTILPGDNLITECRYNTKDRIGMTWLISHTVKSFIEWVFGGTTLAPSARPALSKQLLGVPVSCGEDSSVDTAVPRTPQGSKPHSQRGGSDCGASAGVSIRSLDSLATLRCSSVVIPAQKELNQDKITEGGLSTRNEMCLSHLLYYPRINLTRCASIPDIMEQLQFIGVKEIYRPVTTWPFIIKSPKQYKNLSFMDAMNKFKWTKKEGLAFNKLVLSLPVNVRCSKIDNAEWSIQGMIASPPDVERPYRAEPVVCRMPSSSAPHRNLSPQLLLCFLLLLSSMLGPTCF